MNFSFLPKYWPYFMLGARNTLLIAVFTVLFGVVVGVCIALLRLSKNKILRFLASAYIEFIRGTPLLVQIFIVYYGLDKIITFPKFIFLGIQMARFIPGVIALSINSGAYVAEIVRAGIQAVDRGQTEAARSLGMPQFMCMWHIILPQAIKNILPALCNEFVMVIKETSLASTFFIGDIMTQYRIISGALYLVIEPLLIAGVIYFILTFSLSKLVAVYERRMSVSD